ncbi:MAG: hypothetical protein KF709_07860 [Gemmatimonadaceae bacterium]|nr:hypothetical protein [Gemmatimonadaceae bacterium]
MAQPQMTPPTDEVPTTDETCDHCGSRTLVWRKCKLICSDCRQINKSCADL